MKAKSQKARTIMPQHTIGRQRHELYTIVDGNLSLNLHPGQYRAMKSKAKNVFMFAGSQGGKTSLGPWWLYQEICRKSLYPEYLEEGYSIDTAPPEAWVEEAGDFLAISANYDLFDLKMLPELQKVICGVLQAGKYHGGRRIIELKNKRTGLYGLSRDNPEPWGRIILRSAAAGKTAKGSESIGVASLESATVKAAWLDECGLDTYTIETFDSIKARLRLNRGRIFGTTTLYNYGWLKTEVYDKWEAGDPNFDVIQFDSSINPAFPMEEYLEAKANMPDWKFRMRYQGQFSKPAGMIFGDFDETTQIVDPFTLPRATPVICGVDPGGVNTATVWLGYHEGEVYLFRESLEGNLTTSGHVSRCQEVAHFFTGDVKYVGGAASEEQFRMDWTSAGCKVYKPPVSDVEQGLDRIIELMKRRKLKVFSTCVGMLQEIREYRRVTDSTGEPTEEIKDKRLFHRVDALRYGVSLIRLQAQEEFKQPITKMNPALRGIKPFGRAKIPGLR